MSAPSTRAEEIGIATAAVGPNVLRVGDSFICSGIEPMSIPNTAEHVRQVLIRLPVEFVGSPAVTAVCDSREGPAAAGIPYSIFKIDVTLLGPSSTGIKISAVETAGRKLDGLVECDYVVIGKAKV